MSEIQSTNPNKTLRVNVRVASGTREISKTIEVQVDLIDTPTARIDREALLEPTGHLRIFYMGADVPKQFTLPVTLSAFPEDSARGEVLRGKDAQGKEMLLLIENRPDLKALIPVAKTVQAAISAARQEMWDEMCAPQKAQDAKLVAEMREKVEKLVAKIPSNCVRILWNDTNPSAADGWGMWSFYIGDDHIPTMSYRFCSADQEMFGAKDLPLIIDLGTASAIRPGALGSFASERVSYCSAEDFERLAAGLREKKQAARNNAARQGQATKKRLNREVPIGAVEAYRLYDGDANKAWEDGNEIAWAYICDYGESIEAQSLAPRESLRKAVANANVLTYS